MSTVPPYQITFMGDYVEIRHLKSFDLTRSASAEIWNETLALCKAHGCGAVLRIGPPPRRVMEAQEVIAAGSRLDLPGLKVAYCWEGYRPDKTAALFATHALENGVTVRYFADPDAAVDWLAQPAA
jgi:hypothetical protein